MNSSQPQYVIRPAPALASGDASDWDSAFWRGAETLEVGHFRPESSDHRPRALARLLYQEDAVIGIFKVDDRYVRCVRSGYQQEVWKDSCVEFFAQPKPGRGYFNFEFNCGGAFLCYHIINPERTADGFKEFIKVPSEIGQTIQVQGSLPQRIEPEMTESIVWTLWFRIPLSVFEGFVGPLGEIRGSEWRGNFFKCADEVSHPHWASWAPVDEFEFHRPLCFGTLRFV